MESTAAFNVATRRNENNFFGSPHHKHDALATLVGLPHAEQTFARRIEVFFPGSLTVKRGPGSLTVKRGIGGNVAVKGRLLQFVSREPAQRLHLFGLDPLGRVLSQAAWRIGQCSERPPEGDVRDSVSEA